jgi:hypothetical protein
MSIEGVHITKGRKYRSNTFSKQELAEWVTNVLYGYQSIVYLVVPNYDPNRCMAVWILVRMVWRQSGHWEALRGVTSERNGWQYTIPVFVNGWPVSHISVTSWQWADADSLPVLMAEKWLSPAWINNQTCHVIKTNYGWLCLPLTILKPLPLLKR